MAIFLAKKKTGIDSKLSATPNSLIDLVDYQEDSVVSRTLIDKKSGTVTIFAFDEEQGLSEHTAPFDALLHVFEGEAEVTISGKPFVMKTGTVTILPVGEPHSVRALSRFKMMLTMIRS
jgi:quercetin dioxygenase-like cupin family protein